jgi:hypothetical protein
MRQQPKDFPIVNGRTRIAVAFSTFVFNRIKQLAESEDKTFSQMTEYLVQCGLRCLEESDALEPPNTA